MINFASKTVGRIWFFVKDRIIFSNLIKNVSNEIGRISFISSEYSMFSKLKKKNIILGFLSFKLQKKCGDNFIHIWVEQL